MNYVLLVFSALIVLAGIVLVLQPSVLFNLLRQHHKSPIVYGLAALVRLTFGIALLIVAPESKFPLILSAIGWVAIGAAAFIVSMGPARFSKLMSWVLGWSIGWGRVAGLFTVLFGGFLVYALL